MLLIGKLCLAAWVIWVVMGAKKSHNEDKAREASDKRAAAWKEKAITEAELTIGKYEARLAKLKANGNPEKAHLITNLEAKINDVLYDLESLKC